MKPSDLPYLSIVVASRNDDHGGDPLRRTQIFVNALFDQCQKHRLPGELILVDWNPLPERPKLHQALDFSRSNEYCAARVIEVPPVIHQHLEYGDKLPFFQMIAKNVGIRNARGRFILATNIDILFSDELMGYVARQRLDPKRMYRVNRYDVANTIPADAPVSDQLGFCWKNLIRVHRRRQTLALARNAPPAVLDDDDILKRTGLWHRDEPDGPVRCTILERDSPPEYLHTNACGDFTLLSREKWHELRGYPEFEAFSFHIDSMFCYMAHYSGVSETLLAPPCVIFHIEHSIGSGWSPEGHQALFARLEKAGIPSFENGQLKEWGETMKAGQQPFVFNGDGWGLGHLTVNGAHQSPSHTVMAVQASLAASRSQDLLPVAALRRELSFHKLQAEYLRRENQRLQVELQAAQTGLNLWWRRTTARWKRSYHKRALKVQHVVNNLKRRRHA
jgi:hypothetical protein